MLHRFLHEHRLEILQRSRDRISAGVLPRPTTAELSAGVPMLLAQIEDILHGQEDAPCEVPDALAGPEKVALSLSAAHHGRQLLGLGFTLSQVVHGYGALCQVITGLLDEQGVAVSAREYQIFNLCLDNAIAQAVTAYEAEDETNSNRREVEHLGSLAHELRNALCTAMTVADLIATGKVATNGPTAGRLGRAHMRMRDLIDRSLAEVRLRADLVEPHREAVNMAELFDEVATTARIHAERREIELELTVEPALCCVTDRQLLVSAVGNLVQNAIKYTHPGGRVRMRACAGADGVHIEVADECGGLPEEKLAHLFDPYFQLSAARSGIGLGLPIVLRAVNVMGGRIHVRNFEGKGCIFNIELGAGLDTLKPMLDQSRVEPTRIGQTTV